MQTICRLIPLLPNDAASLVTNPASLPQRVGSAKDYSDVYRYWHAIEYLLAQHRPGSAAASWLTMGATLSAAGADIPSARVLSDAEVRQIDAELRPIPPDDLAAHYDAAALDAAGIYPATWQEWEETFDPLGQVLEHYFFLQQFAAQCAQANAAALLYFDRLADGAI